MGNTTGEEEISHEVHSKDERKTDRMEAEQRAHHIWYLRNGPNVIYRHHIGDGTRTSLEAEDAFDISCDNVAHSINKGKRWEKIINPEQVLHDEKLPGKSSFVQATIPGTVGKVCVWGYSEVADACIIANKGGVQKYVEMEGDKITVREAKGNRANLKSLQSTAGPGPLLKKNRHKTPKKGGKEEIEEGSLSDPSEEIQHVRYSTLEKNKNTPKSVERAWRNQQSRSVANKGWVRKPAKDHILDWYSEQQDALEDELDALYEDQLESEEPLRYLNQAEIVVEKPADPIKEESEVVDEFPLRWTKKELSKRKERREREAKYRNRFIELRPSLSSAQFLENIFVKAKEWFYSTQHIEFLPVSPRTVIIHKDDSELILGMKMQRCTFVSASSVKGEVNVYSAPRFCCTPDPSPPQSSYGWEAHSRNEHEQIRTTSIVFLPPPPTEVKCPLCKKTEETEEVDDTVVVKPIPLFSLSCGHYACPSCWLDQAKSNAKARSVSVSCVSPHCTEKASVSEAAAIFSDGTLGSFRDLWWDSLCDMEDSVHCHACSLLLVPSKSTFTPSARCPCGGKTCRRCGNREHLPLSCNPAAAWYQLCFREGLHNARLPYKRNPVRHLTPVEKSFLKNCRQCNAEGTVEFKNWCDQCCTQISIHQFNDPIDSVDKLREILKQRGKMMNGDYRKVMIDRRTIDKKKALAMEKTVEDGVYLFELIVLTRFLGERAMRRMTDKIARNELDRHEGNLTHVLTLSMQSGGDPEKKVGDLRSTIDSIRDSFAQYM